MLLEARGAHEKVLRRCGRSVGAREGGPVLDREDVERRFVVLGGTREVYADNDARAGAEGWEMPRPSHRRPSAVITQSIVIPPWHPKSVRSAGAQYV